MKKLLSIRLDEGIIYILNEIKKNFDIDKSKIITLALLEFIKNEHYEEFIKKYSEMKIRKIKSDMIREMGKQKLREIFFREKARKLLNKVNNEELKKIVEEEAKLYNVNLSNEEEIKIKKRC
ncbi:MAG: hypothetical protein QW474_02215 [Candidatus Aenigmatarchaeota archaeon]